MKVFVTVLENGSILINNSPITSTFSAGSPTVFERRINQQDVLTTLVENGFEISDINTEPYMSEIGNIK
jgi:hypothetical protein